MTGAVILAAGRGSRLGGVAKALLERDGRSYLERVARTCDAAGVGPRVCVVGAPFASEVSARAEAIGLEVADNPDPERGMSSSVAVGFAHASGRWPGVSAALLWPVDHPWVEPDTVAALVARGSPDAVVIPVSGSRGGHPALVGRRLWPELIDCGQRDGGARAVFRHNRERVVRVATDDPGVVRDVDHPEDL